VISKIVKSGFYHLMTARHSAQLDDFFADISRITPTIRAIAVYDAEGDPSFGLDMEELGVSGEQVLSAMASGAPQRLDMEGGTIEILTLKKQERCVECHRNPDEVRGALLVALATASNEGSCDGIELETLIDTSLRHIMTCELG